MESRTSQFKVPFQTPNTYPAAFTMRYFEALMSLTHRYPTTMERLVYVMGGLSLVLTSSVWSLPALGLAVPQGAAIAMTTVGAVGAVASAVSGVAQHRIFGFPAGDAQPFRSDTYALPDEKAGHGELIVDKEHLPLLRIRASDHYNAGLIEGHMLGETMHTNLTRMDRLYSLIWPLIGAPRKDSDLGKYLAGVLTFIPDSYQTEMRGKVDGYNQWLADKHPGAKPLLWERYVLMHCLPDFMNYNPFTKYAPQVAPTFGCTTTLLRLANYTFIIRVLDWPSYGMAGQYFLQMDRQVAGVRRTMDIANPLLSGGLTVVNENGLFIEMNVSESEKVLQAQGMPALFFNRYCAENAGTVAEIEALVKQQGPLGPYHLTASDGAETGTFHFYQHETQPGEHAIEKLGTDKTTPQVYVVANNGVRFKNGEIEYDNHCDSNERKQNIHAFLAQPAVKQQLAEAISNQQATLTLSPAEVRSLKQLCLDIARLALVCNCESVLCGVYVYFNNQLQEASALTDNLFAQRKDISQMKRLYLPTDKVGMLFGVADEKRAAVREEEGLHQALLVSKH